MLERPAVLALVPVLAAVLLVSGCSGPSPASTSSPGPQGAKPGGTASASGCGLVSAAEVSSIAGTAFSVGKSTPLTKVTPTKNAPVTAHEDCVYSSGGSTVSFFLNTLVPAAPAYEAKAWSEDKQEVPATTETTVDGLPGLEMPEGQYDQVIFYKGQVVVNVTTTGVNAGTAAAVAKLIAQRM